MSFLTPLFLWGAAAAAAPIILHLIKRQKAKPMLFSHLRFLGKSSETRMIKNRWRQWLLLACRVSLLALIALAFARPVLVRALHLGGEDVVFILDTSYSMGYEKRFEEAKGVVKNRLSRLGASDRSALFTAADHARVESGWTSQHQQTDLAVDQAALTARASHFGPVLAQATNLLVKSSGLKKRIVVVTDGQALGWARVDLSAPLPSGIQLEILSVGGLDRENIFIRGVTAPQRVTTRSSDKVSAIVQVVNGGAQHHRGVLVEALSGKQVLAQSRVELAPMSEQKVALTWSPQNVETFLSQRMVIRVANDKLPIDNEWYLAMDHGPSFRVLYISEERAEEVFLRSALRSLEDVGWLKIHSVNSEGAAAALSGPREVRPHVVVIGDIAPLTSSVVSMLEQVVQDGAGVLWCCGDRWDPAWAHRTMGKWMPGQLMRIETASAGIGGWQDPFRSFFEGGRAVPWKTSRHWQARPSSDAVVIAKYASGDPAIIRGKHGDGKTALLTFGLDRSWGDTVLHPLFVPVLKELLVSLGNVQGEDAFSAVGKPVRVEIEGDPIKVVGPRQEILSARRDGRCVVIPEVETPGFYTVQTGTRKVVTAVNVPREESDLTACEIRPLMERLSAKERIQTSGINSSRADLAVLDMRQKWWWKVAAVVLMLALAELWLAQRTYA